MSLNLAKIEAGEKSDPEYMYWRGYLDGLVEAQIIEGDARTRIQNEIREANKEIFRSFQ